MEEVSDYCETRFVTENFCISCFNTVHEVDTKKLTKNKVILFTTDFGYDYNQPADKYKNFYVIKKKKGQKHILYCDVIDYLIENDIQISTGRRFLESIDQVNEDSIPLYRGSWGS